jgi:hypothetical protein
MDRSTGSKASPFPDLGVREAITGGVGFWVKVFIHSSSIFKNKKGRGVKFLFDSLLVPIATGVSEEVFKPYTFFDFSSIGDAGGGQVFLISIAEPRSSLLI